MQNGYYQATGAMVTQFNRLNVITNNLANVNTIGYKRDDVVISDFERIFQEKRDILPVENHTKPGAKFLNRTIDRVPQISQTYTDFSMGGMKSSGNVLDFAITKTEAFFLVDTKNGVRLTKNGSFNLDSDGFLVTKEGYKVLQSGYTQDDKGITLPQNAKITADKDGNLYANNELISKIYIAQPRDIRRLEKEGDNLFKLENLNDMTELDDGGVVRQGFTQISNVNPVTEMVGLIETNRLVDMYQKVMTSHMNDLNQDAIQKLATIKA